MNLKDYLKTLEIEVSSNEEAMTLLTQSQIVDFIKNQWVIYNNAHNSKEITNSDSTMDLKLFGKQDNNSENLEERKQRINQNTLANLNLSIQNGKVNQDYHFSINTIITELDNNNLTFITIEGLEVIELVLNKEKKTIEGIPTKSGTFDLSLKYKTNTEEEVQTIPLKIIINPDPRSLWKDIPTQENILFYKPDTAASYLSINNKTLTVASIRGRSHAHDGLARDDDFAVSTTENQWIIMAVADGAGSAKYSREGSKIATSTVANRWTKFLNEKVDFFEEIITASFINKEDISLRMQLIELITDNYQVIVEEIHNSINQTIENENLTNTYKKDFSTTLLACIAKEFDFGWFFASYWIGDGAMAIINTQQEFINLLGKSDSGEFAGQTRFVTSDESLQLSDIQSRIKIDNYKDFTEFVMMTDGVSDPIFEVENNLYRYDKWKVLIAELTNNIEFNDKDTHPEKELTEWLNFWSQGNHDDRTLLILK